MSTNIRLFAAFIFLCSTSAAHAIDQQLADAYKLCSRAQAQRAGILDAQGNPLPVGSWTLPNCPEIISKWQAAQVPVAAIVLTPAATNACNRQTIANALGDSAASQAAGIDCTW